MFTFGGSKPAEQSAAHSNAAKQPSFFQRMFGGEAKKPEPQGPQTVAEFMKQPRLDP